MEKEPIFHRVERKKRQLDELRPLSRETIRNLQDWFRVELTYTSNALAGNALTRGETAIVIEKGLTIGKKSLRELLEARNHAVAADFVRRQAGKDPEDFAPADLLLLHRTLMKDLDEQAGQYRETVSPKSTFSIEPSPAGDVRGLMRDFAEALRFPHRWKGTLLYAAWVHQVLVKVQPFASGNEQMARLLMNFVLLQAGYPPAIIRPEDRAKYLAAIREAEETGGRLALALLIAEAVDRSLDVYLHSAIAQLPAPAREEDKWVIQLFNLGAHRASECPLCSRALRIVRIASDEPL